MFIKGASFKKDIPAGLAVFLVAVPLCLGIAHASGAPLLSGLISGILGGIVIGIISDSKYSVSGPAAGLTAIVLAGIHELGSFDLFLVAVMIGGILQIIFGFYRAGIMADYIPNAIIKGLLAAIGVILILKQLPHIIGYDVEQFGVEEFFLTPEDLNDKDRELNTLTTFIHSFSHINPGVVYIGILSLSVLIVWERYIGKKLFFLPGSLVVVGLGVFINWFYGQYMPEYVLEKSHLVNVPILNSLNDFKLSSTFPNFSGFLQFKVYKIGLTIAVVASIETLLSIEAIDKLDPDRNSTPVNRELIAQGIANTMSGLIGGLPITSVIVRSSVNLSAGAKSKISAITHGIFLVLAVFFFAQYLNQIPLATLAAVLCFTGFKLASPAVFYLQYTKGTTQFIPFVVTLVAIVFSDILIGTIIGSLVSLFYIVKGVFHSRVIQLTEQGPEKYLSLGENVNFLHKAKVWELLKSLEPDSIVTIDASRCIYIDPDIIELLKDFKSHANTHNLTIHITGSERLNEKIYS